MSQVETTPHEIEGRWKWPDWGRGPYDALSSVMLGPPFEGYLEISTEVDGEPWLLEVSYSKSGFAPRLSDRINAERLYEWDIKGRGHGERKASYNIGSRFPNMRHWESGEKLQLPWENQVGEVDGVDVEFHTSNIEPERGLEYREFREIVLMCAVYNIKRAVSEANQMLYGDSPRPWVQNDSGDITRPALPTTKSGR